MKRVTIMPEVDTSKCKGCKICTNICPVLSIKVVNKKATVDADKCRGCANCADRCPEYAIKMVKRDKPFDVGIDVSKFDQVKIQNLCKRAHLNPEQIVCYCVGTRAEEVAAAILDGAKTPEEISLLTGVRTGCTIECIQPILRLLEAAEIPLKRVEGGWQWYGRTITAWELPEEVKKKYNSRGFYFDEDKELMNRIVHMRKEGKE